MKKKISVMWFRQDLRMSDNPALACIASENTKILPIYIYDETVQKIGSASKVWLHESLVSLNLSLNGNLNFYIGSAKNVIDNIAQNYDVQSVCCNICYEPLRLSEENCVKLLCAMRGIQFKSFNGNYLFSPEKVLKDDGSFYKVFTPYKKKVLSMSVRAMVNTPNNLDFINDENNTSNLNDLKLLENNSFLHTQNTWHVGEKSAQKRLYEFINNELNGYKSGRDFPAKKHVSQLSPNLHFGEISPVQVLQAVKLCAGINCHTNSIAHNCDSKNIETDSVTHPNIPYDNNIEHYVSEMIESGGRDSYGTAKQEDVEHYVSEMIESGGRDSSGTPSKEDIEHFISEMIWREFSTYLLYHFPKLPIENFNAKFDNFTWENNVNFLQKWKDGQTGYPLIDAGMRELAQTGYMHNRVRLVVASFLIKNLNVHWHYGMEWFWECLIDADLANNSASWQWVAGSGADAAPYFRIFNPILQSEKFDSQGEYTKKFVPELRNVPNDYLFTPWTAPEMILQSAGVILGGNYPFPIVDFKQSRDEALERYKKL